MRTKARTLWDTLGRPLVGPGLMLSEVTPDTISGGHPIPQRPLVRLQLRPRPFSSGHILNVIPENIPFEKQICSQNLSLGIFSVLLRPHWSLLLAVNAFPPHWAQRAQEKSSYQKLPSWSSGIHNVFWKYHILWICWILLTIIYPPIWTAIYPSIPLSDYNPAEASRMVFTKCWHGVTFWADLSGYSLLFSFLYVLPEFAWWASTVSV